MIKSHLLYQLSYVPKTGPGKGKLAFYFRGSGQILTHLKTKIKKKYYFFSFFCFLSFSVPDGTPVRCLLMFNAATLSKSSQSSITYCIIKERYNKREIHQPTAYLSSCYRNSSYLHDHRAHNTHAIW